MANWPLTALLAALWFLLASHSQAAQAPAEPLGPAAAVEGATPQAIETPKRVEVRPEARDPEIAERLQGILAATGWIEDPAVRVEEGVVFLTGTADSTEHRDWAGDLAGNTQDVVAVVNKLEVRRPVWDLQPAYEGLNTLGRDVVRWFPFVLLALAILALAGTIAWLATRASRAALRRKIRSPLLREVAARVLGAAVLVLGVYLVLRVSGLSRLALTVIGGTGLIGLVIGIAFRDITENFLASIFLSVQRPFRMGDLVEIVGFLGYVQRLNVRTTVLMTLDGNHVQIPNATVYKSTIRNYTSNPNRREDFTVGIGYNVPISRAQEVALAAVASHPAVLDDPEPWVLADSLGSATVNLRVYFWLNGREHSWLKVRSSIIRLVKRSFQEHGIEMPDEAREIVFPRGVPIRMVDDQSGRPVESGHDPSRSWIASEAPSSSTEPVSTEAEADLKTEASAIAHQASQAPLPELGENLLSNS